MRVHDIGVVRDSAIRTVAEMCQDFGMTFMDAVEKGAVKFSFSKEEFVQYLGKNGVSVFSFVSENEFLEELANA